MGIYNTLLGAGGPFPFIRALAVDQTDYNLYSALVAGGWDAQRPVYVELTINAGIILKSSANTIPAFTVGALPTGSIIKLTNRGYIVGRGGKGIGKGYPTNTSYNLTAPATANGGTALITTLPISIDNASGVIGGGGGAGGVGGATSADCSCDGCGGVGLAGMSTSGGGAGYGDAGQGYSGWTNNGQYNNAQNSSAGTLTAAGAQGGTTAGASGTLGVAGGTGTGSSACGYTNQSGPGTGGAAGACTSGNSFITWINTGSRLGALG
ncbi:hypothetical protein UFOVP470_16 [uncultured Caudovirales phage]|uniref:Uncharacterized protein n=1 Tax=uncultured Caudovirales phage TaxID=2100421 RepID=A0A6J5MCX4_9CAUD|nr:hypothetical protein UFOVP470_16 [uncultured Caudovirales phage]